MDVPIARLRQIIEAISVRLQAASRERAVLTEWSTKTLAQYIAATVPVPKGKNNKLLKSAQKIELFPSKKAVASKVSAEPERGSYERFMSRFGRAMG